MQQLILILPSCICIVVQWFWKWKRNDLVREQNEGEISNDELLYTQLYWKCCDYNHYYYYYYSLFIFFSFLLPLPSSLFLSLFAVQCNSDSKLFLPTTGICTKAPKPRQPFSRSLSFPSALLFLYSTSFIQPTTLSTIFPFAHYSLNNFHPRHICYSIIYLFFIHVSLSLFLFFFLYFPIINSMKYYK